MARLLAAMLVALFVTCSTRAGEPEKQDLFTANTGGHALYRIPGLIVTAKGTLLAYCEARQAGGDWGEIELMVRRSTDGGKTWDEAHKLAEKPADAKRSDVAISRKQGKEGQITMNNPILIADKDGSVHALWCVEYDRCFYALSTDDGKTFSTATEITPAFEAFKPEYAWKVLAVGPGHGTQLSTGRLIVPVWLALGTEGNGHRPSCVTTVFSDDHGKTWQRGAIVANNPEPIKNPSETAAVELADGRVMLNIRHEGPKLFRAVTTSPDGAKDWSPIKFDQALPEPVCFGTLVRYSGGKGSTDKSRILFCNPHNPDNRQRKNLTVKLSEDEGMTWPVSKVIDPGPSGYSDLAVGPDGSIYCLYERGPAKTMTLTLVKFELGWLGTK